MKNTLRALFSAARERELPSLLIGGNAIVLLGLPRMTVDIDLLVPDGKRPQWLDLMRDLGFRLIHGTAAFAQFQPGPDGMAPVDLMFVDEPTWKDLDAQAREEILADQPVRVPRVEHLIALKLHAAISPTRSGAEQDWQDIRHWSALGISIQPIHIFVNSSCATADRPPSTALSASRMNPEDNPPLATALNFPVFDAPQVDHLPTRMTWEQVMDETEPQRQFYMMHYDSPEKRLHAKNPAPFKLH